MFENFNDAQIQFSNAGAFLLFNAITEKDDGKSPAKPGAIEEALLECNTAAQWLIDTAHGNALATAIEALEAMSWFITPEPEREAHESFCAEQFNSWAKWWKEKKESDALPAQSAETQEIAQKLNDLLAL